MKKISICWIAILLIATMFAGCGAPADTQIPETEASVIETAAPTDAPATEAPEPEAPKEGCGSTVAFAAVALMTAAAAFTVKKKD